MRYVMFYKPGRECDLPPSEWEIAAVEGLIDEMTRAGVLVAAEGLQSSLNGAQVRISGGEFELTEGPFAEADDIIGGYAVIQAKSKTHAIKLAKRFLAVMGDGECELRLMQESKRSTRHFRSEESLRSPLLNAR